MIITQDIMSLDDGGLCNAFEVQHIVSVSGGKDSTATYLLAMEYAEKHGFEFRAVGVDTGNEHESTLEYLASLHLKTGGPQVEIIKADFTKSFERRRAFIANDQRVGRNKMGSRKGRKKRWTNKQKRRALAALYPTGNPFLDLCMIKGRSPSRGAQFCTEHLKVFPIAQQVIFPALRNGPVLQWVGVRAEESPVRAKQRKFERQDTGAHVWRPIHGWSVDQVFDIHRRHNITPNPLYYQGMRRVGCMPCVNCSKPELAEAARRFPEHIERIAEWEKIISQVSKRGWTSFFASSNDPMGGDGYGYTIHDAIAWAKTSRGGRQFDLVTAVEDVPQCSSIYGLCA